jgi:hypothetical protein
MICLGGYLPEEISEVVVLRTVPIRTPGLPWEMDERNGHPFSKITLPVRARRDDTCPPNKTNPFSRVCWHGHKVSRPTLSTHLHAWSAENNVNPALNGMMEPSAAASEVNHQQGVNLWSEARVKMWLTMHYEPHGRTIGCRGHDSDSAGWLLHL